MNVDSISAPAGATTFTITEQWDANFAPWKAAKAEYDTAAALHDVDFEQAQTEGRPFDVALAKRVHELATTECEARMELIVTPAPGFAAVAVKLDLLFGAFQFSDFGDEDQYGSAWHRSLTDALIADMARLQSEFAEAWLAKWTAKGGAVVIDDEGKAQVSFTTYDLSPCFKEARSELGEGSDRQNSYWNDGHYYGTMNALFDGLKIIPDGTNMLKTHMRAKGVRVVVPVGTGAA